MAQPPPRAPRRRQTRRGVRVAELVARTLISIGGVGTILAVTMICVFLGWVVVPIFLGADVEAQGVRSVDASGTPVAFAVDEYRTLGWTLFEDGRLVSYRLDDGRVIETRLLFEGAPPTAVAYDPIEGSAMFGFADGSLRRARIDFLTTFAELDEVPGELARLEPEEIVQHEGGIAQRTGNSQVRFLELVASIDDPIETPSTTPIRLVDRISTSGGDVFCTLDAEGGMYAFRRREKKNLLTGKTTFTLTQGRIPYDDRSTRGGPAHLLLSDAGAMVYVAWSDGSLERYLTRDLDEPRLVERVDLVPEQGNELTRLGMLLGRRTLVAGDARGRVRAWFLTRPEGAGTVDGSLLAAGHELGGDAEEDESGAAITALAPSARSRLVATGDANGKLRLWYVTSEQQLLALDTAHGPVQALAIAPKQDGLYAWTPGAVFGASIDVRHPEATPTSLFAPLWYEGREGPEHVWQSSSGTDDFEPKLGLMPLVFGTIKATLYSMLFGAPLALLAALYTSEFLSPRLRAPIKSVTEMMASLPSVVLGFLAGIVIAPFVQEWLPSTLALFVTVPFSLVLGAYLWQLLPSRRQVRWSGGVRFCAIAFTTLFVGIPLALLVGPLLEDLVFAGDLELWLDGRIGSAAPGWMFLTLPASLLAVTLLMNRVNAWLRRATSSWSAARYAQADFAKFCVGTLLVFALAWAVSSFLTSLGLDPRGSFLGTYVQRNALVVGFVMGFAIIPIIYTLAEDALSSVPEHLRLASLGAGATPWQTAVRVIVPTAMSGLFSAVMIGLGRAVGETMIVLMATGNTAVMEWNVFNGFRTLSANIAVELPEAVENDTHYRTLFLAALILFAMTFVLNTFAELVRQRFRKRAFQL